MDLNVLHEKLFHMLLMFDGICRKHNITYYLDSGSAIGAVRDHDFIPWDDDIDVTITRPDYLKLREVLKKELPSRYKLIEPKDYEPYFLDFIPKLLDLETPLRKETERDRAYKNYQNRMSIDFVILDSVPDSKLTQALIKFRCKLFYGMARSKRFDDDKSKMSLSEKAMSVVCSFLGRFFKLEKLINMYINNTVKYADKESGTFIRSNSLLYFIDFYKKEHYKSVVYMDFHGGKVPLPVGYHEILTKMYGDYMTPAQGYKGHIVHTEQD